MNCIGDVVAHCLGECIQLEGDLEQCLDEDEVRVEQKTCSWKCCALLCLFVCFAGDLCEEEVWQWDMSIVDSSSYLRASKAQKKKSIDLLSEASSSLEILSFFQEWFIPRV